MTEKLEEMTILSFKDGDNQFVKIYDCLLNLNVGELMAFANLQEKKYKIRNGHYEVVNKDPGKVDLSIFERNNKNFITRYYELRRVGDLVNGKYNN